MASTTAFVGKCTCGKCTINLQPVESQTLTAAYCHCFSCQRVAMAPLAAVALLMNSEPGKGFTITGEVNDDVRTLGTHTTVRVRCAGCGAPVAARWKQNATAENPEPYWSWSFPLALFVLEEGKGLPPGFPKPSLHTWYKNRTIDVKDGLPKWEGWANYSAQVAEA